jgi:uncharacterized membrane protein
MILFAGMTVLALGGAKAIDAKRDVTHEPAWEAGCDTTSYLPLAAIVSGKTRVSLGEIGWWRLALGLVLYVVLLAMHGWLFGVDPWPL